MSQAINVTALGLHRPPNDSSNLVLDMVILVIFTFPKKQLNCEETSWTAKGVVARVDS